MTKYRVLRDRVSTYYADIEAPSYDEAAQRAAKMSLGEFNEGGSDWNGEPDVEELEPVLPHWERKTLAVVQIVLQASEEDMAADALRELLQHPMVFDWAYLRVGYRYLSPEVIAVREPYVEGAAFGEPVSGLDSEDGRD